MLAQVARLDRLTRDLLSLTQPRTPVLAPVDLAAVLEASAHLHDDLARERGVRIMVAEVPERRVRLDEAQVRRALDNLVLNALQHSPADGTVRLSAHLGNGRVRIRVADRGPGVAAALRERLFDPFVTGRPDGTGLGLAIVREIARAHGGRVHLAAPPPASPSPDAPDPGATFEIDLPLVDQPAIDPPDTDPPETAP